MSDYTQAVEQLRTQANRRYGRQPANARGYPASMRRNDWHAEAVTGIALHGLAVGPPWIGDSITRAGLARLRDGRWCLTRLGRELVVALSSNARPVTA